MEQVKQYTSIGGQAVLEGVMMRSPHFVATAVRTPTGSVKIRSARFESISSRIPFFKKPVIRGVVTLIESMIQGIHSLSFSATIASEEEQGEPISQWAIAGSMLTAFALGMALFVALPHVVTAIVTSPEYLNISASSPGFHLIDGGLKMVILLTYVYLIGLMKDIHRVFQYHGAEHKSIYAFEQGEDLIVENAKRHTTLHPRCGTSFLLFLVLISVIVFSILFPLLGLSTLSNNKILNHLFMIFAKIVLMLPVAGISYEFIKACSIRMNKPFFRMLIWPGLTLQNLTTREPDEGQLEIALIALRQVLLLEKDEASLGDIEIKSIADLMPVAANVSEYPEL